MKTKIVVVAVFLIVIALLNGVAGFAEDGWAVSAFDVGTSRHWDTLCILLPLGLVLVAIALQE